MIIKKPEMPRYGTVEDTTENRKAYWELKREYENQRWEAACKKYSLEPLRHFFVHHTYILPSKNLITMEEYEALKFRKLKLRGSRLTYLKGFMDGWRREVKEPE